MSDYTLTTDDVRNNHRAGIPSSQTSKSDGLFDRWLAAHDAEVAATALEHAAEWIEGVGRPTRTASERLRKYAAEYRKTEAEAPNA